MTGSGKLARYALIAVLCGAFVTIFFLSPRETLSQEAPLPLTGWAWSDTIGWISLHCSDLGVCGTNNYGLAISDEGVISGYAWSEHIGWISANASQLGGCPASPCTARMDGNNLRGWFKALAGNHAESGGWDGFISLSGGNYGPALSNGVFSGYAWGSDVVGWVSFSTPYSQAATNWIPCTPTYQCNPDGTRDNLCTAVIEQEPCAQGLICSTGLCVLPPAPTTGPNNSLRIQPQLIRPGGTATVSWGVEYADSCSVTEDNPLIDDTWTGSSGSYTTSPIDQQTTYTLLCTGPGGELIQHATVYFTPAWREL